MFGRLEIDLLFIFWKCRWFSIRFGLSVLHEFSSLVCSKVMHVNVQSIHTFIKTFQYFAPVLALLMFSFQGDSFTVQRVSRSDNGKPVSCQALTPFTKIYSDTGRSDTRFVKVLCELQSYSYGYICKTHCHSTGFFKHSSYNTCNELRNELILKYRYFQINCNNGERAFTTLFIW